jgi:hypothetical protein
MVEDFIRPRPDVEKLGGEAKLSLHGGPPRAFRKLEGEVAT